VKGVVWLFFEKIPLLDFNDPGEGGDNDGAVVGLALRFALNAPPFGLRRASRSARPTTRREPKNKNQKTNRENRKANQNDKNSEIRTKAKKGHF